MRILSTATALAVALVLVVAATAAPADKAAKKAAKKGVIGEVKAVKMDEGKDTGTFTIKVTPKTKKGAAAPATPAEEKTFKITATTKFEVITGKKANATATPAKVSDLTVGKTVAIIAKDDTAETVKILPKKKKAK